MSIKLTSAYKSIGEVVNILNNEEPKNKKINAHTIRFWQTQFTQLKPKIFNNNRRYYDKNSIELLKFIKFLLKSEGMTIQGVKKHLNQNKSNLDDFFITSIRTKYFKTKLSNLKNIDGFDLRKESLLFKAFLLSSSPGLFIEEMSKIQRKFLFVDTFEINLSKSPIIFMFSSNTFRKFSSVIICCTTLDLLSI